MRTRSRWISYFLLCAGLLGCTLDDLPYRVVDDDVAEVGVSDITGDDGPVVDGGLDGDVPDDVDAGVPPDLGTVDSIGDDADALPGVDVVESDAPGDGGGCLDARVTCGGVCTDPQTDPANCGACGTACVVANGAAACRGGVCAVASCNEGFADCNMSAADGCETDTRIAAAHCGTCGRPCSLANATPACTAGTCTVASCNAGFGNCDSNPANGCEVNLGTTAAHCGTCGRACSLANATPACTAGTCTVASCNAGFADCDSNPANGCETSTATSATSCGACGRLCNLPNTTATCAAGACAVGPCNANFANCDGMATNGCEVDTRTSTAHCGACGRACAAGQVCSGTPGCTTVCTSPTTMCAGRCVVLASDLGNCGRCGNACSGGANATATCTTGMCGITCDAGFGNCDGNAANGCEANLGTTLAHCGGCGMACAPANATGTCAMGRCGIASCNAGFGNCDGNAANGCETNLNTSAANCGTCGAACSVPNATPACVTGRCGIGACNAGFHNCSGTCVSNASAATCGSACSPCPTPANATATCNGSVCGFTCSAGFGDCDSNAVNGCETGTTANVGNCGRCGNVCASGPNSTATCSMGACSLICTAGFGNCDGMTANGCEASLGSSSSHCGACNRACGTGQVCVSGSCSVPAPRPRAPLSTATVTTRRPTLRWVLAAGIDGARVELCRDRACTMVIQALTATGASTSPTSDLPVGVVFWRLRGRNGASTGTAVGPTWQFHVGVTPAAPATRADASWGTTPDFNGDGYDDVVVGEPALAGSQRAYVYQGGSTGLATTPVTTLTDFGGDNFGYSVASAGDVNGDGYADLVVGAFANNNGTGRAYIYHGGDGGLRPTPSTTLAGPGGMNGYFGRPVASAGDVNNDGYADLVVGAEGVNSNTGSAYVYLGGAEGLAAVPAATLTGPGGTNGYFGSSVASVGDLNGDGYADLVVGAHSVNSYAGRAYIYLGRAVPLATTPDTTLVGPVGVSFFGKSVASAGDVNGDGYADLVIGTNAASFGAGQVYVYRGRAAPLDPTPATTITGPTGGGGQFGNSVASAGDVDGDGYADLVIADAAFMTVTGRAYVHLGSATGPAATPSVTLTGPDGVNGAFGTSMASAGDVNGDNYADLVIGAPSLNSNTGRVYFYPGRATPFGPAVLLTGRIGMNGLFGESVASARSHPTRWWYASVSSAPRRTNTATSATTRAIRL